MSCIVGLISGNRVFMGCDSAAVNPDTGALELERQPKIVRVGRTATVSDDEGCWECREMLIGVCGSPAITQAIKYHSYLDPKYKTDPAAWVGKCLLPHLKHIAKNYSFEALVGLDGRLFHVYNGEQFSEEIAGYAACGSGAQVARGAMYVLEHIPDAIGPKQAEFWTPENKVTWALASSERFCSGVRGPFTVLSV